MAQLAVKGMDMDDHDGSVQPTLDWVQVVVHGPRAVELSLWWQEQELFALADYLPRHSVFGRGMEMLRRATYSGRDSALAFREWVWQTFQVPVTADLALADPQDPEHSVTMRFEMHGRLLNAHHVSDRPMVEHALDGKLQLVVDVMSTETEVSLLFLSAACPSLSTSLSSASGDMMPTPTPTPPEICVGTFPFLPPKTSCPYSSHKVFGFAGLVLQVQTSASQELHSCPVM